MASIACVSSGKLRKETHCLLSPPHTVLVFVFGTPFLCRNSSPLSSILETLNKNMQGLKNVYTTASCSLSIPFQPMPDQSSCQRSLSPPGRAAVSLNMEEKSLVGSHKALKDGEKGGNRGGKALACHVSQLSGKVGRSLLLLSSFATHTYLSSRSYNLRNLTGGSGRGGEERGRDGGEETESGRRRRRRSSRRKQEETKTLPLYLVLCTTRPHPTHKKIYSIVVFQEKRPENGIFSPY